MEMVENPLNGFVQIDESLFAKRKNHLLSPNSKFKSFIVTKFKKSLY